MTGRYGRVPGSGEARQEQAAPQNFGLANFFEKPNRRARPKFRIGLDPVAAHDENRQPGEREHGGPQIERYVKGKRAEQNHGCSIPEYRGKCEGLYQIIADENPGAVIASGAKQSNPSRPWIASSRCSSQ